MQASFIMSQTSFQVSSSILNFYSGGPIGVKHGQAQSEMLHFSSLSILFLVGFSLHDFSSSKTNDVNLKGFDLKAVHFLEPSFCVFIVYSACVREDLLKFAAKQFTQSQTSSRGCSSVFLTLFSMTSSFFICCLFSLIPPLFVLPSSITYHLHPMM